MRSAAAVSAPTPRAAAPIDLTGYWVSLVTDDWRWRMVTPPKGDILYLPVNDAGTKVADAWDPAKDEAAGEACRAYGAGGIMHLPGRLRITWDGDTTLKLETDTGQQTRLFAFGPAPGLPSEADLAGFICRRVGTARPEGAAAAVALPAERIRRGQARRFASRPRTCVRATIAGTACRTAPTRTMTEWFTTMTEPDGNTYLLVTKILEDPQYMNGPYVRTVQFKKQPDAAGWNPTPCSAR